MPRRAFTLLEAVISLAIVCSVVIISISNLKDYQQKIEEKVALENFKDTFKGAFNYSYLNKMSLKIYIDKETNIITLNESNNKNSDLHKTLVKRIRLPISLAIERFDQGYTIGKTGQAAPATFVFNSKLTNRKYIYKIQMGWGEIIETTQGIHAN